MTSAGQLPLLVPKPSNYADIAHMAHVPMRVLPVRPFSERWDALLYPPMVEIDVQSHSRINLSTPSTSTLEEIFISIPPSATTIFCNKGGVLQDPVKWYLEDVSDHSPTFWSMSLRPLVRVLPLIIKQVWAKRPMFEEHVPTTLIK